MRIKDYIERHIDAVKCFSFDIENLCYLSSSSTLISSIIGFLFSFIIFIINGGYGYEIGIIKNVGIFNAFTSGTLSIYFGNVFMWIFTITLVLTLICMLINFFKESRLFKRVLMIIVLSFSALFAVVPFIFSGLVEGKVPFSYDMHRLLYNIVNSNDITTIAIVYAGLCLVSIVSFVLLMAFSECREMAFDWLISIVIVLGAVPLLLMIFENIISIVLILLVGAIVILFIRVFGGSSSSRNQESSSSTVTASSVKKIQNEDSKNKDEPREIKFSGNVKFYRSNEGLGISRPEKYIRHDGNLTTNGYVCSQHDFDSGKVIIMYNGRQLQVNEIPELPAHLKKK